MEVIHPRCCGIDVHKESVVACLRLQGGRRVKTEVERFGTTTAELLRLTEWLSQAACTHVAMESTSVYWKPVFNLLEGSFEVALANAWHIKAVPSALARRRGMRFWGPAGPIHGESITRSLDTSCFHGFGEDVGLNSTGQVRGPSPWGVKSVQSGHCSAAGCTSVLKFARCLVKIPGILQSRPVSNRTSLYTRRRRCGGLLPPYLRAAGPQSLSTASEVQA